MNSFIQSLHQKISTLRKPKFIIFTGIALVLLILIIVQQQSHQTPLQSLPTIPPPSPSLPSPLPDRDLKIVWNITPPSLPKALPYYRSSPVTFNTQYTDNFTSYLGFAPNHLVSTNSRTRLWINDQLSLNINLPHGPLTYVDSSTPDAIKPPSQEFLLQSATQHLSNIFPSLEITPDTNTIKYLTTNPETFTFTETTSDQAQFTLIGFRQVIESFPSITPSNTTTPITIILNNHGQIQQLEVTSIINQYQKISDNISLLSIEKLMEIAPQQAIKISTSKIDTETNLSKDKDQTLTVDQLDLVYLSLSNDNTLQPVFRLTGLLSTPSTSTPAIFVVPAFTNITNP